MLPGRDRQNLPGAVREGAQPAEWLAAAPKPGPQGTLTGTGPLWVRASLGQVTRLPSQKCLPASAFELEMKINSCKLSNACNALVNHIFNDKSCVITCNKSITYLINLSGAREGKRGNFHPCPLEKQSQRMTCCVWIGAEDPRPCLSLEPAVWNCGPI